MFLHYNLQVLLSCKLTPVSMLAYKSCWVRGDTPHSLVTTTKAVAL